MKLLNLNLKGFRQHKETYIVFKPGLSGIIGANGSGKSTIIEAIAFCLYGSKAIRGKLEQVKTLGLEPKQEVRVILTFEHEENTYRIERTINDAELYIGGEIEPNVRGNVEVATKITSIFRMNYEEFSATFFTGQKGLEFLSGKKGPAERERFIVRMMGYDKLQDIQELLRSDKKDKKSSTLAWEASLGDRAAITNIIATEESAMSVVNEKHLEAQKQLENAENEVNNSKKIFESMHITYLNYAKLKQSVHTLQIRYEEKASGIKALETNINKFEKSAKQIEKINTALLALNIKIKSSEDSEDFSKQIENESLQLQNDLENAKANLTFEKSKLMEIQLSCKAEVNSLKKQIDSINANNSNLLKLKEDSPCPTCGQELGKTLLAVKNNINSEINSLNSILNTKTLQLSSAGNENEVTEQLKKQIENLNFQSKHLNEANKSLAEIKFQEKEKSSLAKQLKNIRTELSKIQNEIDDLNQKTEKLNFSEELYNSSKVKFETSQRLTEVTRLQRLKIEGELEKHKALIAKSKKSLLDYDEKNILLERSRKELILLEKSDQILTDLRKYLNSQLRPKLSQLASEYLAELSDGRYNTVEIAQDFSPRVLEDGEIKSVISGGEEDLLNLCLRLALSSMLAERAGMSFSTLILDEVFGALDDNRRNNVLILFEKLSKRFEQIIVITHLEDIREGVHNLISVNYNEALGDLEIIDQIKYLEDDAVVNI